MLFTPKLSESGLTFISPIEWYAGVTGATFHETLTNYNSNKHDLYTFNYGYNSTLYSSFPANGTPARIPGGTYYSPSGWNENNFLIKEFGKTPFTPYSVNTAYFLQYGPEYNYGERYYGADDIGLFFAEVRNIAPMRLSPGTPGIGPRWVLLTRDVAMTMVHFQGSNPNPNTQINFLGTDGVVRGYTLAKVPNGTTAAFTIYSDFLICKLHQPVHESIKPVVFLENVTDVNVRYLNQLAIHSLPSIVINRSRNVGYTNARYLGNYHPFSGMDQSVGFYGSIIDGSTLANFISLFNKTQLSYALDNELLTSESSVATMGFVSIYPIIKQNTDLPSGYFNNFKYNNMLIDSPIHNGDSTNPMFLIFHDGNQYRSILTSMYGSNSSGINLHSEFGSLLETTHFPEINPVYNTVEKINKKIINKNVDIENNYRIKKTFDVSDSIIFYPTPKSLDSSDITINYIKEINPYFATIRGLPPFYYPDFSDRFNTGFTTSAVYNVDPSLKDIYSIGGFGYTLPDHIQNKFDKLKPKIEAQFSFANQKTLELKENKKYSVGFVDLTTFGRPDITEGGTTYINYDSYSSWYSLVLLGDYPPGLTHYIKLNNTKKSQNAPRISFYLSKSETSYTNDNLIDSSIKKILPSTRAPYNMNSITTLEELNEIFEKTYTTNQQFVGITSNGYPVLNLNFSNYVRCPIITDTSNNYYPAPITQNNTLYVLDTTNLPQNKIYLHAVANNSILATLPIIIVREINNSKLLSSTSIKTTDKINYIQLSGIQETHLKYIGTTLPISLSPAGITYEWNKIIEDIIPPKYTSDSVDYKLIIDGQQKTQITGITSYSRGITLATINVTA